MRTGPARADEGEHMAQDSRPAQVDLRQDDAADDAVETLRRVLANPRRTRR